MTGKFVSAHINDHLSEQNVKGGSMTRPYIMIDTIRRADHSERIGHSPMVLFHHRPARHEIVSGHCPQLFSCGKGSVNLQQRYSKDFVDLFLGLCYDV